MCELALQANRYALYVTVGLIIVAGVVVFAWTAKKYLAGWGFIGICFLGILVVGIIGVFSQETASSTCPEPVANTYPVANGTLGYMGQRHAPVLRTITVEGDKVIFNIVHANEGGSSIPIQCPRPGDINSIPVVEFKYPGKDGHSQKLEPTDYYCRDRAGESTNLEPGQRAVRSVTFQNDWRFTQPFTFWYYGSTLEGLRLA